VVDVASKALVPSAFTPPIRGVYTILKIVIKFKSI